MRSDTVVAYESLISLLSEPLEGLGKAFCSTIFLPLLLGMSRISRHTFLQRENAEVQVGYCLGTLLARIGAAWSVFMATSADPVRGQEALTVILRMMSSTVIK